MNVKPRVLAALFVVAATFGLGSASCSVNAQQGGGCVDGCRAAYGNCYRSTSNRAACEAQLQRCMQGCIGTRGR